jgi:hypothetical protein
MLAPETFLDSLVCCAEKMHSYYPDWTESMLEVRSGVAKIMEKVSGRTSALYIYDICFSTQTNGKAFKLLLASSLHASARWKEKDDKHQFPHELTAELAANGWLGKLKLSKDGSNL